jgi:hypothetical protein
MWNRYIFNGLYALVTPNHQYVKHSSISNRPTFLPWASCGKALIPNYLPIQLNFLLTFFHPTEASLISPFLLQFSCEPRHLSPDIAQQLLPLHIPTASGDTTPYFAIRPAQSLKLATVIFMVGFSPSSFARTLRSWVWIPLQAFILWLCCPVCR